MELTKEIEAEINSRVAFKIGEILTSVRNHANTNWHFAFRSGQAKYSHYWEALNILGSIMEKEINLPCPKDQMFESNFNKLRNDTVCALTSMLTNKFDKDFYRKERKIVNIVENTLRKAKFEI